MTQPFHLLQLGAPKPVRRKKQKPPYIPTPPRDRAQHASKLLRDVDVARERIQVLQRQATGLTPEQKQAVYLKLETENPIPPQALRAANLTTVRQDGPNVTYAVTEDTSLAGIGQVIRRYGTGPLTASGHPQSENVVANINGVVVMTPEDRMSEGFREQVPGAFDRPWLLVEVEINPSHEGAGASGFSLQSAKQAFVRFLGGGIRGGVLDYDESEGDAYLARVRLTGAALRDLLYSGNHPYITYVDVPESYEAPRGLAQNFDVNNYEGLIDPPSVEAPLVCILDSGVLEGHELLRRAVRNEMSSVFHSEVRDPIDESGHGSGVAGLVLYHSIEEQRQAGRFSPACWVCNARILDANDGIDESRRLSRILEEVVRQYHTAGCKIFNLSVTAKKHKYVPGRRIHPAAATLDKLAEELGVLIFCATGNLAGYDVEDILQGVGCPKGLLSEPCRIETPSQAVNVVTVGSVAHVGPLVHPRMEVSVITGQGEPAAFTRSGPGIGGSLKPDLVEYGGSWVVNQADGRVSPNLGTDVLTTSGTPTTALQWTWGSSFATPKAVNLAARIAASITGASANLIRALLVNSAEIPVQTPPLFAQEGRGKKKGYLNLVGYGVPSYDRAVIPTSKRVIMYFEGTIDVDQVQFFDVPVPSILKDTGRAPKRLSVTLSYFPKVKRRFSYQYTGSRVWWRLYRGDVDQDAIVEELGTLTEEEAGEIEDADDTVEIGEADDEEEETEARKTRLKGLLGMKRRSKGTVQRDVFEWKQHRVNYGETYTLAVVAQKKWDTQTVSIPYALVVSLELEGDSEVDIFTPIQVRLEQEIQVPVEVETQ